MKRILITGSRTWSDVPRLDGAIFIELPLDDECTIVHGACPRGADAMADDFADLAGTHIERYPAKWIRDDGSYDKGAGFARNAEMVALGADVCLAFIKSGSKGATHTADLAEKAGIPTKRYLA